MKRFGPAALLLVLILALAPTVEATTTWTARPAGRGTATLRVGSPSHLTLALTGFRAGSTWTVALRRGSCAKLGTLVASVKVKATSTGRLSKTMALTTTQTRAARLPLTLRFGSACVAFAAAGSGSGPSGNPWTGSAGPWPGRQLFTYPENEDSAIISVAPDGTVYTHGYVSPTAYSDAIRSFQPDGTPSPGWPADGVLLAGFFQDAVLAPGGGLYVSMESPPPAGSSGTGPHATTITALDATGKVKPGWPVVRPMTIFGPLFRGLDLYPPSLVARPAGGVCFVEEIGTSTTTAPTVDLTCLAADGRPVDGWSYRPPRILGLPAFGPDGTLYVDEASLDATGVPQARIVALGPDGRPVAGWTPVSVPLTGTVQIVVGPDGNIHVLAKEYGAAPVLIAVDPHGTPDATFNANASAILEPFGPQAYPAAPVELGPDGTLYLTVFIVVRSGPSVPDTIVAIGPDGRMRPGWPFRPGSLTLRAMPGPDGAIWVSMADGGARGPRLAVLGANGAIQDGWPVLMPFTLHGIAFDRQGRPFFIARPYGRDYLETIDRSKP